jgi:hypothetical protein
MWRALDNADPVAAVYAVSRRGLSFGRVSVGPGDRPNQERPVNKTVLVVYAVYAAMLLCSPTVRIEQRVQQACRPLGLIT